MIVRSICAILLGSFTAWLGGVCGLPTWQVLLILLIVSVGFACTASGKKSA